MAKIRTVTPIVRYMIPCEEVIIPPGELPVSVVGLITNIIATDEVPFPAVQSFCVFLALTDGRGQGPGKIVCIDEELGTIIFETVERMLDLGRNPLEVRGFVFRTLGCRFPRAGIHSLQFWFDGRSIEERPIRVR